MADTPPLWSTPKFLLIALALTFGVFFFGNGICNELLELGVPTWVFGGLAGLLMAVLLLPRWHVARKILAPRAERK